MASHGGSTPNAVRSLHRCAMVCVDVMVAFRAAA